MEKKYNKISILALSLVVISGMALSSATLEAQSLSHQHANQNELISVWEVLDRIEQISPEVLDTVNVVALEQSVQEVLNGLKQHSDYSDIFVDLGLISVGDIIDDSGGRGVNSFDIHAQRSLSGQYESSQPSQLKIEEERISPEGPFSSGMAESYGSGLGSFTNATRGYERSVRDSDREEPGGPFSGGEAEYSSGLGELENASRGYSRSQLESDREEPGGAVNFSDKGVSSPNQGGSFGVSTRYASDTGDEPPKKCTCGIAAWIMDAYGEGVSQLDAAGYGDPSYWIHYRTKYGVNEAYPTIFTVIPLFPQPATQGFKTVSSKKGNDLMIPLSIASEEDGGVKGDWLIVVINNGDFTITPFGVAD